MFLPADEPVDEPVAPEPEPANAEIAAFDEEVIEREFIDVIAMEAPRIEWTDAAEHRDGDR